MSSFYDRDGTRLTLEEWARAFEAQEKKRVAEDTVGGKWVSTVWTGIDHQFGDGPPLIFETMVFPSQKDMSEEFCDRYSTEQEALDGHGRVVEALREGREP